MHCLYNLSKLRCRARITMLLFLEVTLQFKWNPEEGVKLLNVGKRQKVLCLFQVVWRQCGGSKWNF